MLTSPWPLKEVAVPLSRRRAEQLVVGMLLAGIFGLAGVAVAADTTRPGKAGAIAFTRYRPHASAIWSQIFAVNPDGSGLRRISRGTVLVEDDQADWSPNGSTILFQRNVPGQPFSIWSMRRDGSRVKRLSPLCGAKPIATCVNDSGPSYSPNGKLIAFERDSGPLRPTGSTFSNSVGTYSEAIVVADTTFRHVRKVTWFGPYRGDNGGPTWSPDGEHLAFTEHNDNAKSVGGPINGTAAYVVDLDGNNLRRVTPWSLHATVSDWAPDGKHLLLTTEPNGDAQPGGNIYTVRPDGTALQQLTRYAANARVLPGSYAPDGTSIVFSTDAATPGKPTIMTMNADGSNIRRLTNGSTFDGWPDWGVGV
jgi:Tol biopolymer transport system component